MKKLTNDQIIDECIKVYFTTPNHIDSLRPPIRAVIEKWTSLKFNKTPQEIESILTTLFGEVNGN